MLEDNEDTLDVLVMTVYNHLMLDMNMDIGDIDCEYN